MAPHAQALKQFAILHSWFWYWSLHESGLFRTMCQTLGWTCDRNMCDLSSEAEGTESWSELARCRLPRLTYSNILRYAVYICTLYITLSCNILLRCVIHYNNYDTLKSSRWSSMSTCFIMFLHISTWWANDGPLRGSQEISGTIPQPAPQNVIGFWKEMRIWSHLIPFDPWSHLQKTIKDEIWKNVPRRSSHGQSS